MEPSDIVSDLHFDETRFYTEPTSMIQVPESQGQDPYYRQLYPLSNETYNNQQQHLNQNSADGNFNSQLYSSELEPIYNTNYYSETNPPSSVDSQPMSDPLHQMQDPPRYDEYPQTHNNQISQSTLPLPPAYGEFN